MSKTPLFDATGVFAPELRAAHESPARSLTSDDLESGKAAEHLVCVDLIMQGYRAFLSVQGLPYDNLIDVDGAFVRIQVKATRKPKNPSPEHRLSPGCFFQLRRAGKGGRRRYPRSAFDFYALVAMNHQATAYLGARRLSVPDDRPSGAWPEVLFEGRQDEPRVWRAYVRSRPWAARRKDIISPFLPDRAPSPR